jgi:hypothetical protein
MLILIIAIGIVVVLNTFISMMVGSFLYRLADTLRETNERNEELSNQVDEIHLALFLRKRQQQATGGSGLMDVDSPPGTYDPRYMPKT